ncbi:hypothetical protein [Cupriavidus taiwanensis]|uniref:Uncharacterized protein n=1 Tax=Cupriavidus taiwanensis TaxID=164546 RepID=A0A7Z7JFI8_9BURK|nr:hypothetical protein [Cupriavidus taiwanensis]SOZ17258.1 conserved hypothetical protein [Cupriavidus taiwanensis]SOZ96414.1 conserved hypothetical protein [Cupriavidus taiwanensis]SPC25641.1 conserved hypothetical protein [Cupriavidus taiwanensis]
MQPQQHEHPINLEDLSEILCAVAIRAGDFLSLDVLATMSPLQRVMHAVKTANESLSADPVVAKVLSETQAAPLLKIEFMKRRNAQ